MQFILTLPDIASFSHRIKLSGLKQVSTGVQRMWHHRLMMTSIICIHKALFLLVWPVVNISFVIPVDSDIVIIRTAKLSGITERREHTISGRKANSKPLCDRCFILDNTENKIFYAWAKCR